MHTLSPMYCVVSVVVLAACAGSIPNAARYSSPSPAAPVDPAYAVDTVATGLVSPWSLAFLPDGGMLVTEKHGSLRRFPAGAATGYVVEGTPKAFQQEDSGLHDVVLDPRFGENGLVYLAFAEGDSAANHMALFRGRLDGNRLVEGRVIFRAGPDKVGVGHPGGRVVFLPDETLLLTVGDGYDFRDQAQDFGSDLGKLVRLDREGQPIGGPLADSAGARAELYTFGHRNPQGLLVDPRDGAVWEHEHGPRGGDEINRIAAGLNYGWPRATFGIDYTGELISGTQLRKGIEAPVLVWVPSIAPSGFALYLGTRFPEWNGDFLVGALADRSLRRIRMRQGGVVLQETLLRELKARIRDVRVGPDELVYLLTDDVNGMVLRLKPAPGIP